MSQKQPSQEGMGIEQFPCPISQQPYCRLRRLTASQLHRIRRAAMAFALSSSKSARYSLGHLRNVRPLTKGRAARDETWSRVTTARAPTGVAWAEKSGLAALTGASRVEMEDPLEARRTSDEAHPSGGLAARPAGRSLYRESRLDSLDKAPQGTF